MKIIKFPLEMAEGKQVRELDEFQEYFDLQKAIEYFSSGKLQKWLNAIYSDDILEKIQVLTGEEEDFLERFTNALGVELVEEKIDVTNLLHSTALREKLRKYVDEENLEERIPITADSQEILEKRLAEGCKTIYLLGEKFLIPAHSENVQFIGTEKKEVVELETKDRNTFIKQNLRFVGVVPADEETKKLISINAFESSMIALLDVFEKYVETI